MSFCRNFIEGVQQINFSSSSAPRIQHLLFQSAYQALEAESHAVKGILERIATDDQNIPQLKAYQLKQKDNLAAIEAQKALIITEMSRLGMSRTEAVAIDEKIIADIAGKFNSILHLAQTFSDAPPMMKDLQTRLYIQVLYQLDKTDQELQLHSLPSTNLQDMLKQAFSTFEHSTDEGYRAKCQQLVHMVIFELIHRECDKVKTSTVPMADHDAYQIFLGGLISQLIDVDDSTILDTLSQYESSKGQCIREMLFDVEEKLHISTDDDWASKEKIKSALVRRSLFHTLRFGQEDRREYVKQQKDNLLRDLFWARNIRDVQLFTEDHDIDLQVCRLAERRYLKGKHPFKLAVNKPESTKLKLKNKLERAFIQVIAARKEIIRRDPDEFPSGDSRNKLSKKQMALAKSIIKDKLLEEASFPVVHINSDGKITIDLFCINVDKMIDVLLDKILRGGGFGLKPDTMAGAVIKDFHVIGNMQCQSLSGYSLEDIQKQVSQLPLSGIQQAAYQTALTRVIDDIKAHYPINVRQLGLSDMDELLLRKLLELYVFYQNQPPAPELLIPIFGKIDATNYIDVLKVEQLESIVEDAFFAIARLDETAVKRVNQSIFAKARIIAQSSNDRIEKLTALIEVIDASMDEDTKVQKITDIFLAEYLSMKATLGLTEADDPRLLRDISLMARELNWLLMRTGAGLPVLSQEEEATYFSAIQQVAEAIKPRTLKNVQFKIPHSFSAGSLRIQVIDLSGKEQTVVISLNTPIRYSLIKPQGDNEFLLSYGGSRGVIAPFSGFDDAYAVRGQKKERLFTNMRLVGVGQYGSVVEVEELLSGLNRIIKKGYVSETGATFHRSAQTNLKLRSLISRNDPLYRVEFDVQQALSKAAEQTKKAMSLQTRYWLELDKERPAGPLYQKGGRPKQYRILMERAKGVTFADTANHRLNRHAKSDILYHDPSQDSSTDQDLNDTLALSEALVSEAQKLEALGFAHNDMKPENFLYKRNIDGTYDIKFIDWATGGFELEYLGSTAGVFEIFIELFGHDHDPSISSDGLRCTDSNGRFVKKTEHGYIYGINPRLEILHGTRNSTLPYISPHVLTEPESSELTLLQSKDPMMDNWALTAMTFGLCNRHAYFGLVKGRSVSDYVIPGILEMDGETPLGLKIVSVNKFNRYFACTEEDQITDVELILKTVYSKKNAVMYIPSNQREGEPFHLYRHLLVFQEKCSTDSRMTKIAEDIGDILSRVHAAVASGKGLSKEELKETIARVGVCFRHYRSLNDLEYQRACDKDALFSELVGIHGDLSAVKIDSLLREVVEGVSALEVLCTYPKTKMQQQISMAILDQVIDDAELQDKFIPSRAPWQTIFKGCIASGQTDILIHLFGKISTTNPQFMILVKQQGLLHYSLEQGMTDVAKSIIHALQRSGASEEEIFNLMLCTYGPGEGRTEQLPYIKWATNAFHIAVRNNKEDQLALLLGSLIPGERCANAMTSVMHFCARLLNPKLFQQIRSAYNQVNASTPITAIHILNMLYPPDNTSPYHLFLQDESTLSAIDWDEITADRLLAEQFLLKAPIGTSSFPHLIAAEKGNFSGVSRLLLLGEHIQLTSIQWQELFKTVDEHGKNLLNYILEHCQFDVLRQFFDKINLSCETGSKDVLVHLLSNPEPVNPLKNFLSSSANIKQKFSTICQILDAICDNFKTATIHEQQARVIAVLVGLEWFVEQAQDPLHHDQLRALLQNGALSIPFRQIVLEKLKKASKEGTQAQEFYTTLLGEVTLQIQPKDLMQIAIQTVIIERNVAIQRRDIQTIVLSFTDEIKALKISRERRGERTSFFKPIQVDPLLKRVEYVKNGVQLFNTELVWAIGQLDAYKVKVTSNTNKYLIDIAIESMRSQSELLKQHIQQLEEPSEQKVQAALATLGDVKRALQDNIKEHLLLPSQEHFIVWFAKKLLEWISFGAYNSENHLPKITRVIRADMKAMKEHVAIIEEETTCFESELVLVVC